MKHETAYYYYYYYYYYSCIEIQRMWDMECMIIPVITGATGIVTKGLKKKLEAINKKTFDRFSTKDSYTSHKIRKYCSLKLEA